MDKDMPRPLPRRDAKGRLLERPAWLTLTFSMLNAAGLGVGGANRKRCAKLGCRDITLRNGDYCRHHDPHYGSRRLAQLRTGKGKPPTPAESVRLFRADLKAVWTRSPWLHGATIWFSRRLESAFVEDIRRAGLVPDTLAPCVLNNLRWGWRRARLNHDDPEGWKRSVLHAKRKQSKLLLPPVGYCYEPPGAEPPGDTRIKVVTKAASASQPARTGPVIDRSTKCKARQQKLTSPKSPAGFDHQALLRQHWKATFNSLWRTHRLNDQDFDGETGRVLAVCYQAVLDEQHDRAGVAGDAHRQWAALLRQLHQGVRPGQPNGAATSFRRQLPPLQPPPASRPVVHPDNDKWLADLVARVDKA